MCIRDRENSLHVIRGGDRAQTLSSMDVDSDPSMYRRVTAQFTPTHAPISAQGDAVPTCVAVLAAVMFNIFGQQGDKLFQINRCLMDAPVTREALFTQDGKRLNVRAWIRDWTGPCEVDVVETAVPHVYGLTSKDEVEAALSRDALMCEQRRVNIRGILRAEVSALKVYIADILVSPVSYTHLTLPTICSV